MIRYKEQNQKIYIDLKTNTIIPSNIVKTKDSYYRYVNHDNKLLTTGFKTEKALLKYSNDIRFDSKTVSLMKDRYNNEFRGKNKVKEEKGIKLSSNYSIINFSKDKNGNSIIKVKSPSGKGFSIQTNMNLPKTHNFRGKKIKDLNDKDLKIIEKELLDYIQKFGTKKMKEEKNEVVMRKYIFKSKKNKIKEQVSNEKVAELLDILRSENFGNENQRRKMISILASLFNIADPDARKIFKKLGHALTDIGNEMLDDEKIELGEPDEINIKEIPTEENPIIEIKEKTSFSYKKDLENILKKLEPNEISIKKSSNELKDLIKSIEEEINKIEVKIKKYRPKFNKVDFLNIKNINIEEPSSEYKIFSKELNNLNEIKLLILDKKNYLDYSINYIKIIKEK